MTFRDTCGEKGGRGQNRELSSRTRPGNASGVLPAVYYYSSLGVPFHAAPASDKLQNSERSSFS